MNERPWYDNKEGIATKLRNLGDFHELLRRRREDPERLYEWVVLGRFWLDTFGQVMIYTEGAPADVYRFVDMKYEQAYGVLARNEVTWSTIATPFGVPTEADRCPRCGEGWTIRNAHDVYWREDAYLHQGCQRLYVIQRTQVQLSNILERAGIIGDLRWIPSRYHDDDLYFGPWMICETPRGQIVIGWRKRVINIDWTKTDLPQCAKYITDENVTKGDGYIHAWGEDKAVEYLNKIWNGT